MKVKRFSQNRMDVLTAVYNAPDWIRSDDLLYLNMNYRTIQANLASLHEIGVVHREVVHPAYRYKIDKTKDLQFYFDYLKIFRMREQKKIVERENELRVCNS